MTHTVHIKRFRPDDVLIVTPSVTTTEGTTLTTYFPVNSSTSTEGYVNPKYQGLHLIANKTAETGVTTSTFVGLQVWDPGSLTWTNFVDTDGNAVGFVTWANDENTLRHLYIHPALFTDATDGLIADAGKLAATYALPLPGKFRVYVTVTGATTTATLSIGGYGLK